MAAIAIPLRLQRERTLRSRATRGDSAAFTAVYERHHQALYRYCQSIVRHEEDAQDALQSTMTRAFAALQDEQRDFELRPWLFRIAHNEAITILRRRPVDGELDDHPALGSLEDRVAEREELRLLQMDLADLPERQRAALILRELNGLSHVEIGEVLDISQSAVKQAIFDARSALLGFREGRETACADIRRTLSDGDGRVLRGRGVRGHLRSCPECRRFRADLERRPVALHALLPPLPVGGAAALLAQILGGGAAVKLIACIALVGGGGATLAAEMRDARSGVRPAEEVAEVRQKPKPPRKRTPAVAPVATSTPQPAAVLVSEPTAGAAATHRGPAKAWAAKTSRSAPKPRAAKRARAAAKSRAAKRARAAMFHRGWHGRHGRSATARAAKARWAKAAKAWRAKQARRAKAWRAAARRAHSGRGRHGRSARSAGSHRRHAARATRSVRAQRGRSARPARSYRARAARSRSAAANAAQRVRRSVRRVVVKARRTAAPRGRRGFGSHRRHR